MKRGISRATVLRAAQAGSKPCRSIKFKIKSGTGHRTSRKTAKAVERHGRLDPNVEVTHSGPDGIEGNAASHTAAVETARYVACGEHRPAELTEQGPRGRRRRFSVT